MNTIVKLQRTSNDYYYVCITTTLNGIYTTNAQAQISKKQYDELRGVTLEIEIQKDYYEVILSQSI